MPITDSAEWFRHMENYSGTGDLLDLNNSHDFQFGDTSGADPEDPLPKAFTGTQYMYFPGSNGNGIELNYVTEQDTWEAHIRITRDSYTSGSDEIFFSQWVDSAAREHFDLEMQFNGLLRLRYSDDAFADQVFLASAAVSLHTDGEPLSIRITFRIDDGGGNAEARFYERVNDTDSWTEVGVAQTVATFTQLTTDEEWRIGSHAPSFNFQPFEGDFYYLEVWSDHDETTKIIDVQMVDAAEDDTSFTDREGNTATIVRGSSGQVLQVINRAWALLSTDDFFQALDDDNLDYGVSQDGTWMVMFRTNTVASGSDALLTKKDDLTTALGYALVRNTATGQGIIADGTLDDDDTVATVVVHTTHTLAMVRDAGTDIEVFLDGVASGSATTETVTTTLANALVQRFGATAGATPANFFEGVYGADAGWRSALTDTEVLEAHLLLTALPAFPPFLRRQNTLVRM